MHFEQGLWIEGGVAWRLLAAVQQHVTLRGEFVKDGGGRWQALAVKQAGGRASQKWACRQAADGRVGGGRQSRHVVADL